MKKLFTKIYPVIVLLLMMGISRTASAQIRDDHQNAIGASAMCKDTLGNVYVLRRTSTFQYYTAGTAEVVEYKINGDSTVLNSNIGPNNGTDGGYESGTGIAIDKSNNIYVTTYFDGEGHNGNILKLTQSSGYATIITLLAGSSSKYAFFNGLVTDWNNNLYVTCYDFSGNGGNGTYDLLEIPGVNSLTAPYTGTPIQISTHIGDAEQAEYAGGANIDYTPFAAITRDSKNNLFLATAYGYSSVTANTGIDGGILYKFPNTGNGTFGSPIPLKTSFYGSALGVDPSDNLYAVVLSNGATDLSTAKLMNYGTSTTGSNTGTTLPAGTPLSITVGEGSFVLCWGIAPISSTNIYVLNGEVYNSGIEGDIYEYVNTPTAQSTGVTFSSTTLTGTTVSWTNATASNQAVFMAAATAGSPTPSNEAGYTPNTSFNSGGQAGSGWYCVYNGTGTTVNVTNLSPATTYRVMVVDYNGTSNPFGTVGNAGDQVYNTTVATGNPANVTTITPTISAPGGTVTVPSTPTSLAGASTSFNITGTNLIGNVTATAPTNFQVSADNSTWGSTATITASGTLTSTPVYVRLSGTGSVGAQSGNVALSSTSATTVNQAVSGSILQPTIISPSPTVTLPSTMSGTPGSSASFAFAATNLSPASGNITVTAPTNVQVSPDNSTWYSSSYTQSYSGSNLGPTPVYVRLSGTGTVGTIAGNISLSGGGAATVTQAVSGTLNAASTTISSLAAVSGTTTNASSVQYTATFAASISGLSTADFTLNTTGVSGAAISAVSGSGTSWTVTVNTGSGSGTIQLVMNSSSGTTPSVSNLPKNGDTYTIDKTAPTVSSITATLPSNTNPTNITIVTYTVTFSEAVTGVDASDFALTTSGVSGSVSGVSGSGTTYGVTVSGISGTGTLRLDLNSSGTGITDAVGNAISGGFTSGDTYTIDQTAPTISSIAATTPSNASPTNATSVTYTVTFSEAVTGVDATDFALTTSGASGSVSGVSGSGTTYTVTVSSISGDGTLRLDLKSSGTGITDQAGNAISGGFTSGDTYTFDHTAPIVSSITATGTNPTNATSVGYTVTFSESVTGVDASDFTVTTGGASGSVTNVTGSGTTYTVTVGSISGNGTLRLDLNSSGTGITDGAGNAISGGFTGGDTYTIDNTPPTVSSIAASNPLNTNPTNATTLIYNVNFSEPVTGVDASDFTVTTSGTSGSVTNVSGSGANYTVTVSSVTGNGTLRLDLNNSGTGITDAVGNAISGGFTSGDVYTIDNTAPTVSSITATTPSNANPTNATSVSYTVTFSEAVTGVGATSFTATTTNTVASLGIVVTPVSSSVYTVTVNGISGDGTLRLDLNSSNNGVLDLAGNPISGGFTGGDVYTIDNTAPTLTSLVYSSSNANFNYAKVGDVVTLTFGAIEAIQAPTVSIAGHTVTASNTGGNNYSASYTMTSGDTEGRIPFALTVTDLAGNSGNYNDVAAGDDITFDMTPPTILIGPPSVASIATGGAGTVTYTVTYADANFNANTLSTSDITLNSPSTATGTVAVSNSGATSTVTISGITGTGTLGISIGANTASDLAGNLAPASGASDTFDVLSTDATLSNLKLNTGVLIPGFASGTNSYHLAVSSKVTSIAVTPTANNSFASIMVNGSPVNSGSTSTPITLVTGPNTITTVVTAQSGATNTYTIMITRVESGDADLADLRQNYGGRTPVF